MSFFNKIVENKGIVLAVCAGVATLGFIAYIFPHLDYTKAIRIKVQSRNKLAKLMMAWI